MKTKTQHTPGPWRQMAWGQMISIDSVAANYIGVAHINPRGDHNKGIPESVDRANAALIAASPVMYDYIKRRATAGDKDAQAIVKTLD